jgi:hypothetical protein
MTTQYHFSFDNRDKAKSAAKFLLQVHKQVDGYDDWTEEKLVGHLTRQYFVQLEAPMVWFPGFPSDSEVVQEFFQKRSESISGDVKHDV